MSAEALGDQLLREVKEETLSHLLKSLRDLTSPSKPRLGIQSLDIIINAFENPPVTRQQEIYRDHSSPEPVGHTSIKDKSPTVVEITGATSCSGKTQLLYHIISISLLPATFNGITLDGKGQAVALFDLSGRFDILRLRDIMHNFILLHRIDQSSSLNEEQIAILIADSLTHLHVFKPHSTPSLLSTLSILPDYLLARPSPHLSSGRSLALLAISDLSSFLQQDRLDAEKAAPINPDAPIAANLNDNLFHTRYRTLVSNLRHLNSIFSCTIITTNHGLAPTTSVLGQPSLRPHLPAVWSGFCTVSVVVEREKVSKFRPGISIEEAEAEREMRWDAVRASGFRGWVNWWGAEEWREEVKEGLRRLPSGGGFGFRATDGGVGLDSDDA